jgi:hypothetical protein
VRNRLKLNRRAIVIAVCLVTLWVGIVFTASANRQMLIRSGKASPDGIWQQADQVVNEHRSRLSAALRHYRMFQLDQSRLARLLAQAPEEFKEQVRNSPVVIALPMPDGSFSKFSVVESSIMEPGLAKKFPDIKTYLGQGIDDPTAIVRLDWMPSGFHGMILSSDDTVFIEPQEADDTVNYLSYYKGDRLRTGAALRCLTTNEDSAASDVLRAEASAIKPSVVAGNGATLRIYRIAVAATAEYTQAAGGTKQQAMQRIVTSINRVTGVFERDVAVRLVLVANSDKIIYLPGQPQPYTNSDVNAQLMQNQQNLDRDDVIGKANYDLGHVFSTASSGLGALGVVCQDGQKAGGASGGGSSPTGDSFDIDLASQEIGHQFGLNHTFNGSTASCGGGNRSAISAYEPGSGSTIGAYANTCGNQNLQSSSDDYFHIKNIEEMLAYLAASGGCATSTATGNNPPTVNAGPNFTIPKGTPFTLTASANDPDPGDNARLTYAWEEYDLGPQSPPDDDSDGMARPIFRTYRPSTSPSRTFPRMDYILRPQATIDCGDQSRCITGETLPSIARTMNFQVTARDNRAGGGGVASAQMTLSVDGASGPFAVTAPAAGSSFLPGSTQAVTWNVAGTNAGAVNAANVKISISIDGGATFATSLADSVPNNGMATVTLPTATVANARIKVEAIGNVFFNISPAFSIRPPCAAITVGPDALPDAPQIMQYDQAIMAAGGTGNLTLSVTAGMLPRGEMLTNTGLTGVPQDVGTFTFTITATDANGCTGTKAYTLKVVPTMGAGDAGAGGGGTPGAGGFRPAAAGSTMTFPVTLSSPSDQTVTVQYATQDNTAIAGVNYVATSGTLTFAPGETMKFISVMILGDTPGDDCVDFDLFISGATNAMIEDDMGQGDIVENDPSGCPDITVSPGTVASGQVGVAYSQTFTVSGGALPIKEFALDGGSLPPGLSLGHATGALTGTPMAAGTFNFSIAAADNNNCLGSHDYTLTIAAAAPPISPPIAANMSVGTTENTPVSGRLSASNPDGRPVTFQLVKLKDTGNGIPTITNPATGDFTYTPDKNFVGSDIFVFMVSDGVSEPSLATVTVTVTGPDFSISFPSATLQVTRGTTLPIEVDIARSGGFTGPVTVNAPQLTAPGLRLHPASIMASGPTADFKLKVKGGAATGAIALTFTAQDGSGRSRTASVTVNIQ